MSRSINYNTIVYVLKNLGRKTIDGKITNEDLAEQLRCSVSTCMRLQKLDEPGKRRPNSIEKTSYIRAFQNYQKKYFDHCESDMIAVILAILKDEDFDISRLDRSLRRYDRTSRITAEDFNDFITLLIQQAEQFYAADLALNSVSLEEEEALDEEDQKVCFCTYLDLQKQGLTAIDIAKQLLANDRKLYGDLGQHAGNARQWANQIVGTPENWGFLCQGKQIVGNYSFVFVSPEQEQALKSGTILGSEFTVDRQPNPIGSSDGETHIHILNASLNDGYQTTENWSLLWKSFGNRLQQLAKGGVFYRSISACLFREDHKPIFQNLGFQRVASRVIRGEIFWLNLTNGIPKGFRKIMPDTSLYDLYEAYWDTPVTFRQLSSQDVLTEQQLMDIAVLIHDTDRFVYPAMMSRDQAKRILPLVLVGNKDRMFSLDNLFVAMAGTRIIGIILHKAGNLNWSSGQIRKVAGFLGETLADSFDKVEAEYFAEYNNAGPVRSVINCCVHSNWRMHDIKVGSKMMAAFVDRYGQEKMQLYVLRETTAAMRIYARNGFEIADLCNGWSVDNRELPCAFMVREADRDEAL